VAAAGKVAVMLNDPMDSATRANTALPESLRQAVREAEATGRAAEARAQSAMPFRARLRARDAVRPQPTLSILTHSAPITAGPVSHNAVSEVRMLRKQPAPAKPLNKAPLVPVAATAGGVAVIPLGGKQGGSGDDAEDDRAGFFSRMGDFSQFAFAGLAVLGLAGLSVMAAENALGTKSGEPDGDQTLTTASLDTAPLTSSVSAAAVEQASTPAGAAATPWFDYRGTADLLKTRIAELRAEEEAVAQAASAEADLTAAAAIANAEAARVAAEQPAAAAGPAIIDNRVRDRLAAEEAARAASATVAAQLKSQEAAAAARVEADRIAAEEAARAAAAAAEQQRVAQVEAQRAADAEAARLADLAAKKQAADAEAKRLAQAEADKSAKAAEAKRLADIEAKRAADVEAKRLASLEAKRAADAAEATRLANLESRRLADAEAARLATVAAVAATPAPRVWTNPPGRASLKPERPAAALIAAAPVVRTAPPSLSSGAPEVRQLANMPRPVDDFIAERAEYTAGRALDAAALDVLKSDFIKLVEGSADGTHHELLTPDGRPLLIHFERTVPVDPMKASIQAIGYAPSADGFVTRAYLQPVDVTVSVMCRDVSYAFPGQERGRFAACEGADGTWTMARASTTNVNPI
jgi:hypothetical protein